MAELQEFVVTRANMALDTNAGAVNGRHGVGKTTKGQAQIRVHSKLVRLDSREQTCEQMSVLQQKILTSHLVDAMGAQRETRKACAGDDVPRLDWRVHMRSLSKRGRREVSPVESGGGDRGHVGGSLSDGAIEKKDEGSA